jgi:hypothetical protein
MFELSEKIYYIQRTPKTYIYVAVFHPPPIINAHSVIFEKVVSSVHSVWRTCAQNQARYDRISISSAFLWLVYTSTAYLRLHRQRCKVNKSFFYYEDKGHCQLQLLSRSKYRKENNKVHAWYWYTQHDINFKDGRSWLKIMSSSRQW